MSDARRHARFLHRCGVDALPRFAATTIYASTVLQSDVSHALRASKESGR